MIIQLLILLVACVFSVMPSSAASNSDFLTTHTCIMKTKSNIAIALFFLLALALSKTFEAQVVSSTPLSLVIPAYVYPQTGGEISQAYLTLKDSAFRYPEVTHVIVLNPNNGEGSNSPPDGDWQPAIDLLSGIANVKLIG